MDRSQQQYPLNRTWWKEGIIYEVYLRSFKDSNGDGIGDLPGLIQGLDYLKELGIDILWIAPIFASPNADNGYDVSDYRMVMPEFGTMEDFERLLREARSRGLRIILDLVANHSSDEHEWFKQSRASKQNPFRDYYIWRKPGPKGEPPNNWVSLFGGSAWELDEATNEYYLHLFAKKQPDLNWDHPQLREEVYSVMRFWLDKGISGFRMDVIPFISKHANFTDYPVGFQGDLAKLYASGPRLHEYLQEMRSKVLDHYDCVSVGEGVGVGSNDILHFVGTEREELDMVYHFEHMSIDHEPGDFFTRRAWHLPEMKAIIFRWDEALAADGWNSVYFGNHDQPRIVTRYGNDGEHLTESAKMLATLTLTLRGTPFIYQGDEIGMTNGDFTTLSDFDDILTHNRYKELIETEGQGAAARFLFSQRFFGRDNARYPLHWSDEFQAGFTTGMPWLRVHPNYKHINIRSAQQDEHSVLNYYWKLISLRKQHPALVYGTYQDLLPEHTELWIYFRTLNPTRILVVINFSNKHIEYNLAKLLEAESVFDAHLTAHLLLLTNYNSDRTYAITNWRPYETRIYQMSSF